MSLDRYPAVSMCTAFSSMTERRFFYVRGLDGQGRSEGRKADRSDRLTLREP